MSEKTEQQLKKKNKEQSLKYRKKINDLTTEVNSLTEQLERWGLDNKNLRDDNLDLIETIKTINPVIRGIMFQKCADCETEWDMDLIQKMMKNLIIDCPGCDLYIQVK